MYDACPTPNDAFEDFEERHERVNRFFWSTAAAYHFAAVATQNASDPARLQTLLPGTKSRGYLFRRYLSKMRDEDPKARATVADFRGDLKTNMLSLVGTAVIMEATNLELFLRDWSIAAVRLELEKLKKPPQHARTRELEALLEDLATGERLSLSLRKLASHFPAAIAMLNSTTYWRTETPMLTAPGPSATCLVAAQMWREIRNLIVHHDRICSDAFLRDFGQTWDSIEQDIAESGLGVAGGKLYVGSRLPLTKRHVPYCLSACYQTAYVFFLAAGGQRSTLTHRHITNAATK